MLWIYLALIAYFLDAIVFAFDKFLLMAPIPYPLSYAFYASVLSVFAVFLWPFGVHALPLPHLLIALGSGLFFFVALIYFYKTIKAIDVLEATPAVGAITALTTFFISVFILREHITGSQLAAFFLLVAGTFIMSYFHLKTRVVFYVLLGGIFFGFSYLTLKYVFTVTDFVNGLFWTRLGLVGSALAILVYPPARRQIFGSFSSAPPSSKFLFAINKVLAAAAFIVLYYAIKIGSVVFVNALQGLQYVFILLIGFFIAKKMPLLFERHLHEKIARKIVATILIFVGFFLLVF